MNPLRPAEPGDTMRHGVSHTMAYLMGLWPEPVILRAVLRAALPPGTVKHNAKYFADRQRRVVEGNQNLRVGKNGTSQRFKSALERMETTGWIKRGQLFIRIIDSKSLYDYGAPLMNRARMIQMDAVLQAADDALEDALTLNNSQAVVAMQAQRRAVQLLMQSPVTGLNRSGSGSVRRAPASSNRALP